MSLCQLPKLKNQLNRLNVEKMIFRSINKILIAAACGLLILSSSCKKDPISSAPATTGPTTSGTRAELTKDSIYLYAKDTYYWNERIPAYDIFKPRSLTDNEAVLDAIIALPGSPIDKYSFLDDGAVSAVLAGVSGDYGFSVFYNTSPSSDDLRIKYVSPNSPAAAQGLKRGYRITKLNGTTNLSTDLSTTLDFVGNAIFGNAASVSLTVLKPDGSSQELVISKASYSNNPIFLTKVIQVGSKKIGYIVYNSFTSNSKTTLATEIGKFQSAGATELIVDLRYNGGGSVSTADDFTDLIAPTAFNGQVMYTTVWTKKMQEGKANILVNQPLLDAQGKLQLPSSDPKYAPPKNGKYYTYADISYLPDNNSGNVELFNKIGTAEFKKIYFLVLGGTASASELLINNLKGVMSTDVKLIGRQTYGKPVGFFAIHIDKLDLYIPQFETKNNKNEGGYFNGMTVDYPINDDVTKDFGDPTEKLIAAALSYSEKGTFSISNVPNKIASLSGMSVFEEQKQNEAFDKNVFKGMVDDKLKLKKQ